MAAIGLGRGGREGTQNGLTEGGERGREGGRKGGVGCCLVSDTVCVCVSQTVELLTLQPAARRYFSSSEHLPDVKFNHGSRRLYQMHQVHALCPQLHLLGKRIMEFYSRLLTFMFCPVCAVPPSPDVASDSVIRALEADSLPFSCRPTEEKRATFIIF